MPDEQAPSPIVEQRLRGINPDSQPDTFEQRVQIVVRALLAVVLVAAYIAFLAFGVTTPDFYVGLVGLAAGFFVGGTLKR